MGALVRFVLSRRLVFFIYLLPLTVAAQQAPTHQPPSQRATFYVDALGGDDHHSGLSPATAWRTIDRVNQHVFQPGERLLFKAGQRYEGQLKITSGTSLHTVAASASQPASHSAPAPTNNPANPRTIRIDRYGPGAKPRIEGNGLYNATVVIFNTEYLTISNLDISNYGVERKGGRTGILVEIADFGVAHSIRLDHLDIHHVNGSLVKKEGGGAGIIFQNGGKDIPSRFDGILVEDCTIKYCERNGIIMNGNWSRESWFANTHVRIRKNLIEDVPGDGIVPIGCDSALIEYNVMRGATRLLPDGESAAGIWPWSCDNTLVQYNEVSGHKAPWDGQGFDADWNCRNTIIQYNYSHDNEGGFLLICNDGGAGAPNSIGTRGTIVRYNISVNDGLRNTGKHAGFSPIFHITGPTVNTHIYNNLIYVPAHQADMDSTLVEFGNWHGYADSTFFDNNIFYVKGIGDYAVSRGRDVFFNGNAYLGQQIDRPADPAPATVTGGFLNSIPFSVEGTRRLKSLPLRPAPPHTFSSGASPTSSASPSPASPPLKTSPSPGTSPSPAQFLPGKVWMDDNGEVINAHGGGILYDHGKYYWFGEKRGGKGSQGVNVYSSSDLYHWKFEALALSPSKDTTSEITAGCVMERPKVIYNKKTRTYVLWFHLELKGKGYSAARAAVAVSKNVTGPYTYVRSFRPNGNMSRDMTLFTDDDGAVYHIYSSRENYDMRIARLSDDYLSVTTADSLIAQDHQEAPAIFKYKQTYYLITSACTGWAPNKASLYTATAIFGPWQRLGNPMRGDNADLTFGGQSTYVLPLPGKKGGFIFIGDRWNPHDLKDSRYLWLPIEWHDNDMTIPWKDAWSLPPTQSQSARPNPPAN